MRKLTKKKGFVLPLAVAMIGIIMAIGLIVIQSTIQSQRNVSRHGYQLMAREAAKAGADFAKERFEASASYSGTPENRNTACSSPGVPSGCDINSTVLYNSSSYQIVYSVEVISTSGDGLTKNIRSIGKVYIPDIAMTAAFVQDIRTAIIRRGTTVAAAPSDFSPVLWFDADDAASLEENAVSTSSQTLNIATALEETTSGTVASSACSSDDLELFTQAENSGTQNVGVRFTGINIPKNATVTNAYIQFKTDETKQAGTITARIKGIAADNVGAWSCPASNQLSGASKTTAQTDWTPADWNTVGQSGSNQRTPSLTTEVQEIVNRSGWNAGNAMAFYFAKQGTGSGVRTAERGQCTSGCTASDVTLYVEWQVGSYQQAGNGDTIERWKDKSTVSGGGRHLLRLSGTPKLRTSTLNSKSVVEFFTNGSSTETVLGNTNIGTVLANKNAATVLAVMKPTSSGGGSSDRYVTFVNSAQPNETQAMSITHAMRAFYRSGNTASLTTSANNLTPTPITSAVAASFAAGSWGIFTNRFSNTSEERFTKNGVPTTTNDGGSSIDYNVNQVFLGATTNATNSYSNPGDMQIAELIVYDKELSCEQIESIELYLQNKWNVTTSIGNCPVNTPIAY